MLIIHNHCVQQTFRWQTFMFACIFTKLFGLCPYIHCAFILSDFRHICIFLLFASNSRCRLIFIFGIVCKHETVWKLYCINYACGLAVDTSNCANELWQIWLNQLRFNMHCALFRLISIFNIIYFILFNRQCKWSIKVCFNYNNTTVDWVQRCSCHIKQESHGGGIEL